VQARIEEKQQLQEELKQKEEEQTQLAKVDIVREDCDEVKEGLERIRRKCQVERKQHDSIEEVIFGKEYKPEAKVKVGELQCILEEKLKMSGEKAYIFSRYLVEPREEG